MHTRRNPDILMPGGTLKGNLYVKRSHELSSESDSENLQASEPELSELDEFERMKKAVTRYYKEKNPTRKCKNCKEFGHMSYECANERRRLNCILCGKDTHDSFDCDEKLCFKCNKGGHKASECNQKDVVKCGLCTMLGHPQSRCLKVWDPTHKKGNR